MKSIYRRIQELEEARNALYSDVSKLLLDSLQVVLARHLGDPATELAILKDLKDEFSTPPPTAVEPRS